MKFQSYGQFREKLAKKFVISGRCLQPEFTDFRKDLLAYLIDEFGSTGRLDEEEGQWPKIFNELSYHSEKYRGKIDSKEFRKSLRKGEGDKDKVFVLYYGLHTYKRSRINPDTEEVEYPYKEIAKKLDRLAFETSVDIDSDPEPLLDTPNYTLSDDEPAISNTRTNTQAFDEIEKIKPFSYLSKINFVVEEGAFYFDNKPADKLPYISDNSANKRFDSPASLLKWNAYLTKFEGRKKELEDLQAWWSWCSEKGIDKSCLLIHGKGGTGKTRLAAEFAKTLPEKDWTAGFINLYNKTHQCIWQSGEQGILLIIDYPEEQTGYLSSLLVQLNTMPTLDKKLRLILLSRNDTFINGFSLKAQSLFYRSLPLTGFSKKADASLILLDKAWQAIMKVKMDENGSSSEAIPQLPITGNQFNDWELADINRTPLMILALAYYLVGHHGKALPKLTTLSNSTLIRDLTFREIERIEGEVEQYNAYINTQNDPDSAPISLKGTILTKAVAAIPKGFDAQSLNDFIGDITNETVSCYPPTLAQIKSLSLWQNRRLEALEPDILAADFLAFALEQYAEVEEASWIFSALGFMRIKSKPHNEAAVGFKSLGRLIYDTEVTLRPATPHPANRWQWPITHLASRLERLPDACDFIADHCDKGNMANHLMLLALSALNSAITRTAAPAKKAGYLIGASTVSYQLGQSKVALKAIQLAVEIYQRLASTSPECYEPNWAVSLINLSNRLADLGHSEKALEALQQAVEIYERLASVNPELYEPNWALILNNLSQAHAGLGQQDKALDAIQQSVEIYQRLANVNPELYESDWALSLNNLSNCLAEHGQQDKAFEVIQESVEIYQRLANVNPELYESDWARSLNNLSARLVDQGQAEKALDAIQQTVEIYQRLASTSPERYESSLIYAMNVRASQFAGNKQLSTAIGLFEEIEQIYSSKYEGDLVPYQQLTKELLTDLLYSEEVQQSPELKARIIDLIHQIETRFQNRE